MLTLTHQCNTCLPVAARRDISALDSSDAETSSNFTKVLKLAEL